MELGGIDSLEDGESHPHVVPPSSSMKLEVNLPGAHHSQTESEHHLVTQPSVITNSNKHMRGTSRMDKWWGLIKVIEQG